MSFAYLHESFPDPTKTFVYREVLAMHALGMAPEVFSIRQPSPEEQARVEALDVATRYLPDEPELRRQIDAERNSLSRKHRRALSHWRGQKGDSNRVFEALWIGHELRQLGIRHVHAHFAGLAARTAWLIQELWGIPYSFTGHADDIFSPEQKPIALEMLVKGARFIATETDYSRERLHRDFPAARGKTFRVFNGIEIEDRPDKHTFTPPWNDDPPRVMSVGRLVEKKGFPDLIRALALLRDQGISFHCDLVGGGPLEKMLRDLLVELGLTQHVVMHGAQPHGVVQGLLKRCRLFALAARQEGDGGSDNLPTVIMEAMAAGVPVVSTRLAGIPEMVVEGETGMLVAPEDVAAFANSLANYLCKPDLAAKHGARGHAVARERFSIAQSVHQLASLLVKHAGVVAPPAVVARFPELKVSFTHRILQSLRLR